jgi:hypothetical protein
VLVIAPGPLTTPDCDGNVICPEASRLGWNPPAVLRPLFGTLNCGVLNTLKNSDRNCSFTRSVTWKFLNSEKSRFFAPGPSRTPTPELP